jgi:hypothetical protein
MSGGVFVYQRKNVERKGADACERACKRHACDMQQCIARLPVSAGTARMNVGVCNVYMDKWNKCCDAVKALQAASAPPGDTPSPAAAAPPAEAHAQS